MALIVWVAGALSILLAYVSLDVMGFLSRKSKFQVEGKTVLLTGASQGMGREVAKLLSQRGANLVLVSRSSQKLQSTVEYAKSHAKNPSTQRFHYISADVTTEAENVRILKEATAWNNGRVPEVVWTVAGASFPSMFLEQSFQTQKEQMDVNYWGPAYLAQHTLRSWLYPETPYEPREKGAKAESPRHLIITSSTLSFFNVAGYGTYSVAKTGLKALCEGLRYEVLMYNGARRSNAKTKFVPAPFDVNVQIVYPGTIQSPGHEIEEQTKPQVTKILEEADPVQTADTAAYHAIRGLERGQFASPTNWLGELMRLTSIGGAPREAILRDTLGVWLASIAMLFIGPDMDGKTWAHGKKLGMPDYEANRN
ncbi:3-ketodihydrosphingosine reductase, Tsc10 [Dendryphion nanum]|uniref:3-ketodihydrosphingosine reductase, Tsc10 n=1 Tax=Dendryphion nanum TaxID=256645 RepID=A0A9P9E4Y8_9PLEO|nr:3-ketodihydrosphingosine reductase, Tsc10 [Dendryphion nanum]